MAALDGWANFYVIVGSSAGALIGLQFVVITLIADKPIGRDLARASGAFSTPGVVHFAVVLLLSAIITAPWNGIGTLAQLWGLIGACGIVYTIVVFRRMRIQRAYRPVFEDWLFHTVLPLAAYVFLAIATFMAQSNERPALFFVGATSLLLLFIGIHNSWDAVTYHVFARFKEEK